MNTVKPQEQLPGVIYQELVDNYVLHAAAGERVSARMALISETAFTAGMLIEALAEKMELDARKGHCSYDIFWNEMDGEVWTWTKYTTEKEITACAMNGYQRFRVQTHPLEDDEALDDEAHETQENDETGGDVIELGLELSTYEHHLESEHYYGEIWKLPEEDLTGTDTISTPFETANVSQDPEIWQAVEERIGDILEASILPHMPFVPKYEQAWGDDYPWWEAYPDLELSLWGIRRPGELGFLGHSTEYVAIMSRTEGNFAERQQHMESRAAALGHGCRVYVQHRNSRVTDSEDYDNREYFILVPLRYFNVQPDFTIDWQSA